MSKLANILGVTDESDLHNIVDNKEGKVIIKYYFTYFFYNIIIY